MTRTAKANPEQMQTNGVASLLYTQGAGCSIHPSPIAATSLADNGLTPESESGTSKKRGSGYRSGNRSASFFTYFIQSETGGNIKVGKALDPGKRLRDLQCGSPLKLVLLATLRSDIESQIHEKFKDARVHGEWFEPIPDLLDYIHKIPGAMRAAGCVAGGFSDLAKDAALKHCRDGEWIWPGDLDAWASVVRRGIEFNCENFDDDPDEFVDEDDNCDCDVCGFDYSIGDVKELKPLGYVWRPGMLCTVIPKPATSNVREDIRSTIGNAYPGFDFAYVSLNLIFIDRDGKIEDGESFAAYLAAIRESRDEQLAERQGGAK